MTLKPARLQWSEDGRLLSLDYGDVYFQPGQALAESDYVFLRHNNLPQRFAALPPGGGFRIAELGFGTGVNFLLAAKLFLETAPADAALSYVSIEKHPIEKETLEKIHAQWPDLAALAAPLRAALPPMIAGFHSLRLAGGRVRLLLCYGDVAEALPALCGCFDAWFLDGFAPDRNPGMWAAALFPQIAARTAPGGTLASFSVAGHLRRALAENGFAAEKAKGFGKKRDMTVARFPEAPEAAKTPAATPPRHVAVVGAGIAGCAAARALAIRGLRVTLIDRHASPAQETSGNPLAVVYPKMTVDPSPPGAFYQHAFCFTRQLLQELEVQSFRACGVLHADRDAASAARHADLALRNGAPGDYAVYRPGEGLWQPGAGFLSPREFCAALAAHPNIAYASFEAAGLRRAGGEWRVENARGQAVAADAVVLAAGMGSLRFGETQWLPLQSLRGQVTMIAATPQSGALAHVVCGDGYITPAAAGLHCIGATFQKEPPGDAAPRPADDAENIAKVHAMLPGLGLAAARVAGSRAGYRATTPDKLPLVGPCPDRAAFLRDFAGLRQGKMPDNARKAYLPGLYIATGFGAHGMTGAPLAGEIIAAQVTGDPLPVPAWLRDKLLPERFILRDLKRKII